jgi:hypothetical protein
VDFMTGIGLFILAFFCILLARALLKPWNLGKKELRKHGNRAFARARATVTIQTETRLWGLTRSSHSVGTC